MSTISDIRVYAGYVNSRLSFGEWLGDQLKDQDLTQVALAETLNVAPTTVNAWVNGVSKPRRRSFRAIATAIGVSLAEFERAINGEVPATHARPARETGTAERGIDLSDPLIAVSAANADKLTDDQKRALAEVIRAIVRDTV
jgi:transcriptional regulator with XRE-family HTH domain